MLTSLLPPSACASCRLCCHFLPSSVWETPALEPSCATRLREQGVFLVERLDGGETVGLSFSSDCPQETADCPLLDKSSGCRLPREERPLECRLWPLRLMRGSSGQVVVACYTACPGIAAVSREELLALAESLRPLLRERASSFPASIRPLHAHYAVLFPLVESLPCS